MKSIHVPRSRVQQIVRALQALAGAMVPVLGAAALATWKWFGSRVDGEYVAKKIAPVSLAAKAAQATATTAASRVPGYDAELVALWKQVVVMHGELMVQRAYGSSRSKHDYIEKAKKYYANAYDTERETRPGNPPSKSAQIVLRTEWRPGM